MGKTKTNFYFYKMRPKEKKKHKSKDNSLFDTFLRYIEEDRERERETK